MNSWIYLIIAGIGEILWVVSLKFSQGFTKFLPSVLTLVFIIFSLVFLSYAIKEIPIGTAYACWTAIGAIGAVIIGVLFFNESISVLRVLFLFFVIVGIVGLKLTSF